MSTIPAVINSPRPNAVLTARVFNLSLSLPDEPSATSLIDVTFVGDARGNLTLKFAPAGLPPALEYFALINPQGVCTTADAFGFLCASPFTNLLAAVK